MNPLRHPRSRADRGGIVLVLAHNWADLPRAARAALSFLPMPIAQGLAGWVVGTRTRSLGWREGSAVFLLLTLGSSIALIGQTYHIHSTQRRTFFC